MNTVVESAQISRKVRVIVVSGILTITIHPGLSRGTSREWAIMQATGFVMAHTAMARSLWSCRTPIVRV